MVIDVINIMGVKIMLSNAIKNYHMSISIGVKDYKFSANPYCIHGIKKLIHMKLSFQLCGDFLSASIDDDFNKTIDYAQLCDQLSKIIAQYDCSSLQNISDDIKLSLGRLSLVYRGEVLLEISCHVENAISITI